MKRHLEAIGNALEKERRSELEALRDRLHLMMMNVPCDTSAIGKEFEYPFKLGHKQARHQIADAMGEIFVELGI